MCRVSHKLKLCTCSSSKAQPRNYWIFHRYNSTKNISIMGEPMLPASISPEDDAFNDALLLKLLNKGDVFDTDLHPQNQDRLQLSFYVNHPAAKSECQHIHYGFEYHNGQWQHQPYEPLEWESTHDEEEEGKITHPKAS
ncbi:MAG: hypothetical protein JNK66_09160 [Chitinophagales bacterium]|nr:hypothetical protein [Chitinophagales bacterium]